jgi:hypothetical protein
LEEYQFYEGELPSAYRYNFEPYLFNREEYRLLQSAANWISFYILNEREFSVEGHLHFYLKDDWARSIMQSPFGGIEFNDRVENKAVFHFIEFVCKKLKERGIKNLTVISAPNGYHSPKQTLIELFFLNLGFVVSTAEVGSLIHVSENPFSEILHPRKKRKLAQTLQADLSFKILEKNSLEDIYEFIAFHRKEKNYQLSISLEHLKKSVEKIDDVYKFFGVFDGGTLVAASIAVLVSKKILYHFISDHLRKVGEAKPVLALMNGIYDYCFQNNIIILDLGTSAKESQPNFKLIKFKSEIGGVPTHKFTFTKRLA